MLYKSPVQQYIHVDSTTALVSLTDTLFHLISKGIRDGCKSVVFLCIGTDRSTGDSLGPLIGYKISSLKYRNIHIHGTLETPVHAKNLAETVEDIGKLYDRPYIVAIDACLGKMDHVGYVSIGEGPVKPGSGVNKNLAPVGDMYITGIVNFGGFMDFLILQNTRLNMVMKMADLIATGIRYVAWKVGNDPEIAAYLQTAHN